MVDLSPELQGARINLVASIEQHVKEGNTWTKINEEVPMSVLVKAKLGERLPGLTLRVKEKADEYTKTLPYKATVEIDSVHPVYI